jgi:hypothetical protein
MAETVKDFPRRTHKNRKYNWESWFDGSIWKLKNLVDYKCNQDSFLSFAHREATKRGYKLKTQKHGKTFVFIQAIKQDD